MSDRLPPLNALRAFEVVARHLSFKEAAKELFVTPAAVSHQVKILEQHLEVELFVRLNRAIELTEAGRLLYLGVHDGLAQLGMAVDRVRPTKQDHCLVIGMGPAFAAKWLAPRLHRFITLHADIDARISANVAFADFGPGGIDVAIRFSHEIQPRFFSQLLALESVVPVCSPSLQLTDPEQLREQVLMHDDSLRAFPEPADWSTWLQRAGIVGVESGKGPRFSHADHGIDAAVEGAGVLLARKILVANDLRSGRLVKPFELELETDLGFYFVCPRGTENESKIQTFRHWLTQEFDDFNQLLLSI